MKFKIKSSFQTFQNSNQFMNEDVYFVSKEELQTSRKLFTTKATLIKMTVTIKRSPDIFYCLSGLLFASLVVVMWLAMMV